jgi:hypothetical protein|nr:MAG TPA: hypothetical protein [Caudoviricetes sp.]
MKKVLSLAVSKKWFDLIASGIKREEYREIKPYWEKRLLNYKALQEYAKKNLENLYIKKFLFPGKPPIENVCEVFPAGYTHVRFTNGYGICRPSLEFEVVSITFGKPQRGLCPDEFLDKDYFVIKFK